MIQEEAVSYSDEEKGPAVWRIKRGHPKSNIRGKSARAGALTRVGSAGTARRGDIQS